MYLQCLLISHDQTDADEHTLKLKEQTGAKQITDIYKSVQYRSSIRANHKYIDSRLSTHSRSRNKKLKDNIEKHFVEFVLVSPLKADLETCLDVFADNPKVSIVVDPLLVPRVNSLANISEGNAEELQKFKKKPNLSKLQANPKWYLTFGKNSGSGSIFIEAVDQVQKDENYESEQHYHERLSEFRKDLIHYIGPQKSKVAVIAHPQVLEGLTSTGHYQDFTLINSIPFGFGEVKAEFVWIQGIEGQLLSSGIPFCS